MNIYKKDSYDIQLSIKEHSEGIFSFIQLKNGKIITCSHDKTMKIWKLNNENKYECIKTIYFQKSQGTCDIFKLNENEFVTSSENDECIKFWNSNNYSNITTINKIDTWMGKIMCLLENDLLCVGGYQKGFYLIKISNHQLIKNIFITQTIYCIKKCLDGLFLCSFSEKGNHFLVKYKYEEQDLKKVFEKEKAHNNFIRACVELDNGIIASGGEDNLIKLWKN